MLRGSDPGSADPWGEVLMREGRGLRGGGGRLLDGVVGEVAGAVDDDASDAGGEAAVEAPDAVGPVDLADAVQEPREVPLAPRTRGHKGGGREGLKQLEPREGKRKKI